MFKQLNSASQSGWNTTEKNDVKKISGSKSGICAFIYAYILLLLLLLLRWLKFLRWIKLRITAKNINTIWIKFVNGIIKANKFTKAITGT